MSDSTENEGNPAPKRQRVGESAEEEKGEDVEPDTCIVCMRNAEELNAAESPMMPQHSCPQCNPSSWSICEECEEHCLSRKCPVCRGEYAPIVLYAFPDLQPNTQSSEPAKEISLFKSKIALLTKLVGGSNTAMYLPGENILRFLLPQEFGNGDSDVQLLQVDISDASGRITNGQFEFTDRVWDELEAAQTALEEGPVAEETGEAPVSGGEDAAASPAEDNATREYSDLVESECPEQFKIKLNKSFTDSEDAQNFTITAICRSDRGDALYYKYYDTNKFPDGVPAESSDFEYTPCEEILSADWVVWTEDKQDWIQCVVCDKWRKLPKRGSASYPSGLPDDWTCAGNTWDDKNNCSVVEDAYDDAAGPNGQPPDGQASAASEAADESGGQPQQSYDTIGLDDALKRIIRDLKNVPGAQLFTRLPLETTENILRVAMETSL